MGKRKKPEPSKPEAEGDATRPQIPLRFDKPDLKEALDNYCTRTRSTRTGVILNLIEKFLREEGEYPLKE